MHNKPFLTDNFCQSAVTDGVCYFRPSLTFEGSTWCLQKWTKLKLANTYWTDADVSRSAKHASFLKTRDSLQQFIYNQE